MTKTATLLEGLSNLPNMKLSPNAMRIFRRARRKCNVSIDFLKSNISDIRQFVLNAVRPHLVTKIEAVRKSNNSCGGGQRVILNYCYPRRFPLNPALRRTAIARHKRNMQHWSKRMVLYLRSTNVNRNYANINEEDQSVEKPMVNMAPEEVSKQLKVQLELLRMGKRTATLIEGTTTVADSSSSGVEKGVAANSNICETDVGIAKDAHIELGANMVEANNDCQTTKVKYSDANDCTVDCFENSKTAQESAEKTPEKQIMPELRSGSQDNLAPGKCNYNVIDEKTEEDDQRYRDSGLRGDDVTHKTHKPSGNFLDMLMSKVVKIPVEDQTKHRDVADVSPSKDSYRSSLQNDAADLTDSSEDFLGFEETERVPGMLLTPLVPYSKKNSTSSAFVSESLNKYMRENLLETDVSNRETRSDEVKRVHRQANLDGLVTPTATPPNMSMPAVPDSLLRLRTVAERRQFLQKFSKNHKLAIINNEATIYRELQRKIRQQKVKSASLQMLQTPGTQMPFTRQGWQAASFVVTDCNKYFYQMLQVDGSEEYIKLPGVCGNNETKMKKPYLSRPPPGGLKNICSEDCYDQLAWRDFKSINTPSNKAKLHKNPFRPVFPPCPLSQKPFQKPLDEETAALLLAGGSMAVVQMPTVELEVFPEVTRPLHEIAKRYLEYILPHHEISREWAEFSVSTLQYSAEQQEVAAAPDVRNGKHKSFTFAIPYLNDRNHILVRRVVDRSEQLDRSFEECRETSNAVADLSFRTGIDPSDRLLNECADVVSDMINSVAISCSENSFIKNDPDEACLGNDESSAQALKADVVSKSLKLKEAEEAIKTNEGKLVVTSQLQSNRKQKSLLLELRRLNATIIDAGTKPEKAAKPCYKDYCLLGCICPSLTAEYPLRQHCGKAKCIIECNCRILNNSRIMRLETDGRSITTEDAFLLRRQATARLARIEKEFTSTIVLTGNETLLINDSQYDKKRRCTKAPKRYDDFTDADDDFQAMSNSTTPRKTGSLISIESTASPPCDEHNSSHSNSTHIDLSAEMREPIYIKDTIISELKHCTVALVPLQDTKNMVAWCMIHELYKCFCGGRAVEGKAVTIEKEEDNVTTSVANAEVDYALPAPKAHYSFEKTETGDASYSVGPNEVHTEEDSSSAAYRKLHDSDSDVKEVISSDDDENITVRGHVSLNALKYLSKRGKPMKVERRGRPMEGNIIRDYLNTKLNCCRRVIAVPMKTYTRRNRRRVAEVQEFIKKHENVKTQLILNEHILRSVYYHKHEFEKALKANREKEQKKKLEKTVLQCNEAQHKKPKKPPSVIIQEVDDADDDVQFVEESSQSSQLSQPSFKLSPRRVDRKRPAAEALSTHSAESLQKAEAEIKKPKISCDITHTENIESEVLSTEQTQSPRNDSNCAELPKTCAENQQEHLNCENADKRPEDPHPAAVVNHVTSNAEICEAATGTERQTAEDLGLIEGTVTNESFKEFYNVVIKNMNNLVSKKMQDIDMALKRESKVIPPPNEEILCIIKWSNFLDAFVEGYVFIWQVQLGKQQQPFFAATITNLMPMILGAVGVVNIAALRSDHLPLIGRMLLEQCRTEQTHNLAIVMQGRSKYWLVKGFLHPDSSKACAKPTPQTHPALTRKINLLCSLLVKQRVKEHQRKLELQQLQREATQGQTQEDEHLTKRAGNTERASILPVLTPFLPSSVSTPEEPCSSRKVDSAPAEPPLEHAKEQDQQQPTQSTSKFAATKITEESKRLPVQSNSSLIRNLSIQPELINMKSNIEFRKLSRADINDIQQPEMMQEDHRWLVLDLCNDFSHIFVPDFSDLVSLDRIQKVMAFSRQKQKIVKLQFFQNAPFDAFVTPLSRRKIYFGPLKFNMRPPLLILLQSVDGQMMLREVFQKEHHIQTTGKQRTTAFWILQVNGQIKFEIEMEPDNESGLSETKQKVDTYPEAEKSDEEDCVIVESESRMQGTDVTDNIPKLIQIPVVATSTGTTTSISSNSIANTFPNSPLLPPPQIKPLESQTNIMPNAIPVRMNFTIQAMEDNKHLQITQNPTSGPPQVQLSSPVSLVPLGAPIVPTTTQMPGFLPLSVVITNVASAPREAPYSSTIYVSNVQEALTSDNQPISNTDSFIAEIDIPPSSIPATPGVDDATTRSCTLATSVPHQLETSTQQDLTAKRSCGGPIKRRRMSLRCPRRTDIETRNIAIDAAMKLLPESESLSKEVCFEQLENSIVAKRPKLIQPPLTGVEAQTGTPATSTMTTMLRHNTTITKINGPSEDLSSSHKVSKARQTDTEQSPKLKFLLPKTEMPQKCAPQSGVAAAAPIVFDVNFMDNSDEPAASIVIKPTSVATSTNTVLTNSSKLILPTLPSLPTTTNTILKSATDFKTVTTVSKATMNNNPSNVSTTVAMRYTTSSAASSCLTTNTTSLAVANVKPSVGKGIPKTLPTKVRLVKPTASTTASLKPNSTSSKPNVSYQQKVVQPFPISSNPNSVNHSGSNKEASDVANTKTTSIIRLPKCSAIIQKAKICSQVGALEATTALTTKDTSSSTASNSLPSVCSPKKTAAITASVAPQRRSFPKPVQTKVSSTSTRPVLLSAIRTKLPTLPPELSATKNQKNGNCNDVQYGFIASNIAGLHKFVVKRIGNEYLVKVPSLQGILKLTGLTNVNAYLNKYISKTIQSDHILRRLPAIWTFVAQDRLNPINRQKHVSNHYNAKLNVGTQCVAGDARAVNAMPMNSVRSGQLVSTANLAKPAARVAPNLTAVYVPPAPPPPPQEQCDTILIED